MHLSDFLLSLIAVNIAFVTANQHFMSSCPVLPEDTLIADWDMQLEPLHTPFVMKNTLCLQLHVFLPCDRVDLDVLLPDRLVQLPLHPKTGPKECEEQRRQEAKHNGARYDNLVVEFLLHRHQVGPSTDQRQPHSIQKNPAEGAQLLLPIHDLLGPFALYTKQ